MTNNSSSLRPPRLSELIDKRVATLLGPPPILPFEAVEKFEALHAELVVTYDPKNMIEHIWVRDLAEIRWEIMRLRDMRRAAIENALPSAAADLMATAIKKAVEHPDDFAPGDDPGNVEPIARGILRSAARGSLEDRIFFNSIANDANVSHEMIKSVAYAKALKVISALDHAIASAQVRFDQVLRSLDSRRATKSAMEKSFGLKSVDVVDVGSQDGKEGNEASS